MMPGRVPCSPDPNNLLGLSWHDSAWISILNPTNVLSYFAVRSNPFYDRQCNNEIIKMQRLAPDQLVNMTGIEYMLLHVQEPILYVIRKIHRHSPTQVTPLSDYYIIAGVVYQAPDLGSVINSRLLTAVHNLQSTFDDIFSMARYNPSKGYSWDIKNSQNARAANRVKDKKEEISSSFHRQRVDLLIRELTEAFPLDLGNSPSPVEVEENVAAEEGASEEIKEEDIDIEIKDEETELVESSPADPPSEESSKDTVV